MRHHSARLWPHLAFLALSLSLIGCGSNLPPNPAPEVPAIPQAQPDSAQVPIPKAFTSGATVTPIDMRSDAPPPDSQPQGNLLTQPGQPPMSLDDLQGALPPQIPQGMAGRLLQPLNQGPIANVPPPGAGFGAGDGCAYGVLPGLVDYGVYPRLLYYPFHGCWIPYILLDDCYYPYVYQPFFDPLFTGYCYYPLFVFRHGYYYPYFFHSRAYYYGYLDWEYNWPGYRDHYRDYDWDDIGRHHWRRYNDDDFKDWRNGKVHKRDRADWERPEPPRKGQPKGGGGGGDRPTPRERPNGDRPNGDRPNDDRPKGDRPGPKGQVDRPGPQERPDRSGQQERPNGDRPRKDAGPSGNQEKGKPQRQGQIAKGEGRPEARPQRDKSVGERAPKAQKPSGQQAKGDRKLQSDEEDDQDQLD